MNKIPKVIKVLMFSGLLLSGLFFASFAFAGLLNFGGRITTVIPCTCSTGSQVNVVGTGRNAQFSGSYLYLPGITIVKGKGKVLPSRIILGKYSPGGTCMVGVAPECTTLPITKGTKGTIGTN